MKKIISLILVCSLAFGLIACGNSGNSGNTPETTAAAPVSGGSNYTDFLAPPEHVFEPLEWPTYGAGLRIPVTKSSSADITGLTNVQFQFYVENTTYDDYVEYVEECKSHGFILKPIEQENRYYALSEDQYELTVEYQEGDIMFVEVVEVRFRIEIKLLHTDKTSADMYNLRIEIDGYWEEDSEKGDEAISFDPYLREGPHTLKIENDDDDDISGRIDFVATEEGQYLEFEINCLSNKIEITQIGGTTPTADTKAGQSSENNKVAAETDVAYPVDSDVYMSLSAEEVDEELSILRQMMRFGGKNKSEALAAYSELGDDEWSKLLMDGELFGIKGQYAFVYSDDVITSFGFHWMMDDYETHSNHIIYCLNTYFGDYTTSKEFYTGGTTYSQYKWTKTTDDMWFVHLSLQDSNSGWLEITPTTAVEEEKESFVVDGCFTITADDFADAFEEAFDGINGYTFEIKADVDDTKSFMDVDNYVYYRIVDDENYDRDVGMISFTKPNGKTLHISEEYSSNCWNSLNMLIEEADDVSAAVVATVFAVDPGIGYSEAFDVAQSIVDSISFYTGNVDDLEIVNYNDVQYVLYRDSDYHYLLVSAIS